MSRRVLVRAVPASYADVTSTHPDRHRITVEAAHSQHATYVAALREAGWTPIFAPEEVRSPDSCFVEDTLVVARGVGLLTRSGHPGRRCETDGIAATVDGILPLERAPGEARIDGGDVLRVGATLFVGRSGRTDEAGVAALRRTFSPRGLEVCAVDVAGALHLKCGCSSPLPGLVLVDPEVVDPRVFGDATVLRTDPDEGFAANAVGLGSRVLVDARAERMMAHLAALGLTPVPIDAPDLRWGDGALTCLSVLLDPV